MIRTRRERLSGHSYTLRNGVRVLVRRSCRDELKLVYESAVFAKETLEAIAAKGKAEVLFASKIHPSMKDLWRIELPGARVEAAAGGGSLLAFFKGKGRLRARHELEAVLGAA